MSDDAIRSKTVSWEDPVASAAHIPAMSGLEYLTAMLEHRVPGPPIARLMGFTLVSAREGEAVFTCSPDESVYNPIGTVHGGLVCTLLDSACGCAVQSTLEQGLGYTSIDLSVSYLRPIFAHSGELRCVGRVVKPGRRVAFAEAEVSDGSGRVIARATSSLLVFPIGSGVAS
ncbi:PaaI family thioesterase [Microbacteriaceae bacterium VKM Ac-2855]|nr:PaaI family thioesterase [Microbacteriaceae bacterium VKM Ac-2855]